MSLKSLMVYLKRRSVTPVTREMNAGVTTTPAGIGTCTLVTPVTSYFVEPHEKLNFYDVLPTIMPVKVLAEEYRLFSRLAPPVPQPEPKPKPKPKPTSEPHTDHSAWRELARAYHRHHFACPTCIAAGQGRGLRCGTGAALWVHYQDGAKH